MADQNSPDNPRQRTPKSVWVGAERYIQMGLTLPAATVVGWIVGELLNRWLHREWLPLAGLIFGAIAGLVYFIRTALSEEFKE